MIVKVLDSLEVGEVNSNEVQTPAVMFTAVIDIKTLVSLQDPEVDDTFKIQILETLVSLLNS